MQQERQGGAGNSEAGADEVMEIRIRGIFSSAVAMDLSALLKNAYPGQGYIVIDTDGIESIERKAPQHFFKCLDVLGLPVGRIFYTGQRALQLSGRQEAVMHKPFLRGDDGEPSPDRYESCLETGVMIH